MNRSKSANNLDSTDFAKRPALRNNIDQGEFNLLACDDVDPQHHDRQKKAGEFEVVFVDLLNILQGTLHLSKTLL